MADNNFDETQLDKVRIDRVRSEILKLAETTDTFLKEFNQSKIKSMFFDINLLSLQNGLCFSIELDDGTLSFPLASVQWYLFFGVKAGPVFVPKIKGTIWDPFGQIVPISMTQVIEEKTIPLLYVATNVISVVVKNFEEEMRSRSKLIEAFSTELKYQSFLQPLCR